MFIGKFRGLPSAGGAFQEPFLYQERLVHFLQGPRVLADGCGDGGQAHWAAFELLDDGQQDFVVHFVQSELVDVQGLQGEGRDFVVDDTVPLHHGEIPHPPQQGVGDAGSPPASGGYLLRRLARDFGGQYGGRPLHDARQHVQVVILQVAVDAETGPQGRGQQSAPRGSPYQRERVQLDLHGAGGGPLVDHDVDFEIFHGGVQVFLHHRTQAVDFVDEEHVVLLQVGQQARQVARLVQHGARGDLDSHSQLVRDDCGKRRLAQSRGAVQQHVVQRLSSHLRRLDEHLQIVHHLLLSVEILERQRPQRLFQFLLAFGNPFASDIKTAHLV